MRSLAALLLLLLAAPAQAVIIDGADGSANTTPPPDDPGMAHVGNKQGLTGVYIGNRWILTAAHVPAGPILLDGVSYIAVENTRVVLDPVGEAALPPDLSMYRIWPEPPLARLAIRQAPIAMGLEVVMIGNGRDRGPEVVWNDSGTLREGYQWAGSRSLRWGENGVSVETIPALRVGSRETDSFATSFTEDVGPDECQAANGDSGGAVFAKNGALDWELAGIMYAVGTFPGQPSNYALYGNATWSADLGSYRDQILAIRDAPEIPALPPWGPGGLAALLALAGRRALRARGS